MTVYLFETMKLHVITLIHVKLCVMLCYSKVNIMLKPNTIDDARLQNTDANNSLVIASTSASSNGPKIVRDHASTD